MGYERKLIIRQFAQGTNIATVVLSIYNTRTNAFRIISSTEKPRKPIKIYYELSTNGRQKENRMHPGVRSVR